MKNSSNYYEELCSEQVFLSILALSGPSRNYAPRYSRPYLLSLSLPKCCAISAATTLTLKQLCKITAWQEVFLSVVQVQQRFWAVCGQRYAMDGETTVNFHLKFMVMGSIKDKYQSGRPQSRWSEENVKCVHETLVTSKGKL
ncbi:hypothetical protein SK128_000542 [Halocaridina rubra]|uniref:Uncharacterized protein n=1 Tax=Halocaridina rubra TaxID=373956 RepID=A0AAN8WJM3_HALRR